MPVRVRLFPAALESLTEHVLTAEGFAVVASVVTLVPDEGAAMIAEDDAGNSYNYGIDGFVEIEFMESARVWFGQAILQPDLRD